MKDPNGLQGYAELIVGTIMSQWLNPESANYTRITDPQEFEDLVALLQHLAPESVADNVGRA